MITPTPLAPEMTATVTELKPQRLLSPAAARYCGLSPKTLANKRTLGEGPRYYRSGPHQNSRVFYLVADLDAWINAELSASGGVDSLAEPETDGR